MLFLLIGGAIADRLPRHRVMVAANALNCVSQAAFAWLVLAGDPKLWQMMLLTALCGTGQAFFNPAAEGMLMSSVSREQASRAFALFRMSMQGAAIGGAALGGARPWGFALAAFGVGTLGGAFLMTRWKPRRLLLAGTLCVFPLAMPSAGLAVPLPVAGLCVVMFVSGVAIEVFGVSWMTAMHQEIPEEKLSRVSAYDWFGSVAMMPVATALAGPVEALVGRSEALWGCAGLILLVTGAVLFVPEVRNLTRATVTTEVVTAKAQEPASADAEGSVGRLG